MILMILNDFNDFNDFCDALEASIQFPGIPILGPIPWPNSSGMASTVIEWKEGEWTVLRAGSVVVN